MKILFHGGRGMSGDGCRPADILVKDGKIRQVVKTGLGQYVFRGVYEDCR